MVGFLLTAGVCATAVAGDRKSHEVGSATENPSGVVTLRESLRLALVQNPDLAVADQDIRVAEVRLLQAGLSPNPSVIGDIQQPVKVGGKRAARVRAARFGGTLARWDYESRCVETLAQTAQAFIAALAAQERLPLIEADRKLAAGSLPAIEQRIAAGATSPAHDGPGRQPGVHRDGRRHQQEGVGPASAGHGGHRRYRQFDLVDAVRPAGALPALPWPRAEKRRGRSARRPGASAPSEPSNSSPSPTAGWGGGGGTGGRNAAGRTSLDSPGEGRCIVDSPGIAEPGETDCGLRGTRDRNTYRHPLPSCLRLPNVRGKHRRLFDLDLQV